jgi:hypothetical protein
MDFDRDFREIKDFRDRPEAALLVPPSRVTPDRAAIRAAARARLDWGAIATLATRRALPAAAARERGR